MLRNGALAALGSAFLAALAFFAVRSLPLRTLQPMFDELRNSDELRRAKEAAERASRAKSQFLSSMSHELRTPLNAMLGNAQLLALDATQQQEKEQLETIIKSGWHLLELINQVLDLSKIQTGEASYTLDSVDVADLLQECASLSRPLALQRRMHLASEPCGKLHVRADRTRLKQAVLNYLSNAAKYGRDGGRIRLSAVASNGRIRIAVADDGEGIPVDRQKELFIPFSRLGHEGSSILGVGLGLSLTKQIVEQMGGTVGAVSTPGEGNVFWLELPAAADAA
jgi:hypothetical protein